MTADWPALLETADFCRIRFSLDFFSPCRLGSGELLRLRKPLLIAARRLAADTGHGRMAQVARLFEPAPSVDPFARKKHQKPAPPFVIRPDAIAPRCVEAGDRIDLEVIFLGAGIDQLVDFLHCLAVIGRFGLSRGEGHFDVSEAVSLGLHGQSQIFWCQNQPVERAVPVIHSLAEYLPLVLPAGSDWQLTLETPARLVRDGRLLRAPQFVQLFPYLLRRVTSMLYAHCALEVCPDPDLLMAAAAQVRQKQANWRWLNWGEPGLHSHPEQAGGLTGQLWLEGAESRDLLWVIALAALFGVGRGAAYGAGRLRLTDA